MAHGNGIEGPRFGNPPSLYSEGFSNPRSSRLDAKAQRVALAIFVSLASFVFLPPKIAVLTSVFVILWACCYNSDSGASKVRRQRDSYFSPSSIPNLFPDGQGSSSQESAPNPLLTPNPFPDSHSSFNQERSSSPSFPTPIPFPVDRGSFSQGSPAVLPSRSSVLRAPSSDSRDPKPASRPSGRSSDYSSVSSNSSYTSSSGSQYHQSESTNTDSGYSDDPSYGSSYESPYYPTGYTNTDSDYYSVGGDSSSIISFDPPAGSQRHPDEVLASHVDSDYFTVGEKN